MFVLLVATQHRSNDDDLYKPFVTRDEVHFITVMKYHFAYLTIIQISPLKL